MEAKSRLQAGARIAWKSTKTESCDISSGAPGFHEPIYTAYGDDEGNSRLGFDDASRDGYVGISVTDQLIFALYSGSTRKQCWCSFPANTIIVFSWEGRPLAALMLAEGAAQIAVSEDGSDLYAIYHEPVPLILRYEAPALSEGL